MAWGGGVGGGVDCRASLELFRTDKGYERKYLLPALITAQKVGEPGELPYLWTFVPVSSFLWWYFAIEQQLFSWHQCTTSQNVTCSNQITGWQGQPIKIPIYCLYTCSTLEGMRHTCLMHKGQQGHRITALQLFFPFSFKTQLQLLALFTSYF